jgi:hypothetical protein
MVIKGSKRREFGGRSVEMTNSTAALYDFQKAGRYECEDIYF